MLDTLEGAQFVEVGAPELCLFDHLGVEATLQLHHKKQHLVVRTAREQYFACVEFVQSAAY